MIRLEHWQAAALRRKLVADWLINSFSGSAQTASRDEHTGDVLVRNPDAQVTRFGLDQHGFIGKIVTPLGRTSTFENDSQGKLLEAVTPAGLRLRREYDSEGLPSRFYRDGSGVFDLRYTRSGLLREIAFADGTAAQLAYSEEEKLVGTTDRLGVTERYGYDEVGRLVTLEDGRGSQTRFLYSEWDRPDTAVHPDGGSEHYSFDANGYLCRLTWADGVRLDITNDTEGHPLTVSDDSGETDLSFSYDGGRVVAGRSAGITATYDYDEAGRLLREAGQEDTIEYRYDEAGTLVGLRYPSGEWVEFGYDADLRLASLRDWDGGVHRFTYDADDRGYQVHTANGLTTIVRQAPTGFPTSITARTSGRIRREVFSLRYEYDDEDRVRSLSDSAHGTRAYEYDAEGQLLTVTAGDPRKNESFAYDAAGNRIECNGVGAAADMSNRLRNEGNTRLSHDRRGSVATIRNSAGAWSFKYNSRNQLARAAHSDGRRITFGYDAFGRRVWKQTGEVHVRYVWAGEQLVREVTRDGSTIRTQDYVYLPGTYTPFATRIDGKVYVYHTDHLGVPRRLTDGAGKVVWSADYSAYGTARVTIEEVPNPLRLPGQYWDSETGLHYNRFRYYSPELGRYLSRDPLSFVAGLNLYRYAGNDPINSADPLGLWSWKTVASVAAAVVVGVAVVALAPVALPVAIIAAGIAAGAVGAGLNEALHQDKLCLSCILAAAGKGALVGGIAALPFAALSFFPAAGVAAYTAAGAVSGAANYTADHFINRPTSQWSWSGFGASVAFGATTAGVSRYIGVRSNHSKAAPTAPKESTRNALTKAASRAHAKVGPGKGSVHGTKVHSAFKPEVEKLGLNSEVSYLNGKVVKYGTKGSVRLDAVEGNPSSPTAVYDLKTGTGKLTRARVDQIRKHLPNKGRGITIEEIR